LVPSPNTISPAIAFTPLFRNRFASWFHKLARKPPAWINGMVGHLPFQQQAHATQQVALHFQHLRRLSSVFHAVTEGNSQDTLYDTDVGLGEFASILTCLPETPYSI
jgi:hypothetical protein